MGDRLHELEQRSGWPRLDLITDYFEKIITLIERTTICWNEEFFNGGRAFKGCKQNFNVTKEVILPTSCRVKISSEGRTPLS